MEADADVDPMDIDLPEQTDDSPAPETQEEGETELTEEELEAREDELAMQLEILNNKTMKAFASTFDISEDFDFDQMNLYQSGAYVNDDEAQLKYYEHLLFNGPVSTLLSF